MNETFMHNLLTQLDICDWFLHMWWVGKFLTRHTWVGLKKKKPSTQPNLTWVMHTPIIELLKKIVQLLLSGCIFFRRKLHFLPYIFTRFPLWSLSFFIFIFIFRESFNLWRPLLMIDLYHQIKTPINFWCRRGLNPRSLIQLSKTLSIELTGTHVPILYFYHFYFLSWKMHFVFVPTVISETENAHVANGVHYWHTKSWCGH